VVIKEEDKTLLQNKSEYKTSYAIAIVDRFIRTIKDKLESFQKLNTQRA